MGKFYDMSIIPQESCKRNELQTMDSTLDRKEVREQGDDFKTKEHKQKTLGMPRYCISHGTNTDTQKISEGRANC